VAWPRLRGHVLPGPAETMATQHRVAMPPADPDSAPPSDGRVAWPRLRGHVLPGPAANMATQHRVAMPPPDSSPTASDPAATDSALAADGGLVDLLAAPALDVLTVS